MKTLAMLMDDISNITPYKDSSLAMLLEAQHRGFELLVFDTTDMIVNKNQVFADVKKIKVFDDTTKWFEVLEQKQINLSTVDYIFMRKDPPFNMNYIYATYMLDLLVNQGVKVVNNPASLRNFNEKASITLFPSLTTDTLISSNKTAILEFTSNFEEFILKPLDGMGGADIFKHKKGENIDNNLEYLTSHYTTPIMIQNFIPEIIYGDKRIIIVGGKPIEYCIARIPAKGSFKGNLAQGATAQVQQLSARDREICKELQPFLQHNGLDFVGIDVIGDYLSEINITSPTGIREIDKQQKMNISGVLFDAIN